MFFLHIPSLLSPSGDLVIGWIYQLGRPLACCIKAVVLAMVDLAHNTSATSDGEGYN